MKKILITALLLLSFTFIALQVAPQAEALEIQTNFEYDLQGRITSEFRNVWYVPEKFLYNGSGTRLENYNEVNSAEFDMVTWENELTIDIDYFLSGYLYFVESDRVEVTMTIQWMDYNTDCTTCRLRIPTDGLDTITLTDPDRHLNYWDVTISNTGLYKEFVFERTWKGDDVPSTISPQFTFSDQNFEFEVLPGDEEAIYLADINIIVTYLDPITVEDIIDVDDAYEELPDMEGQVGRVIDLQEIDALTNTYTVTYLSPTMQQYSFDLVIPEGIDDTDPSFSPSLFRVYVSDGDLYLIYVPVGTMPLIVGGDIQEYLAENMSYVMNVTDGTYDAIANVQIYAVVHYYTYPGSMHADAYFYMDMLIDDFLSMSLSFQWRYKRFILGWTEWRQHIDLYEINEVYQPTIDAYLKAFYASALGTPTLRLPSGIEEVTLEDLPEETLAVYQNQFDLSLFELEASNLYRVPLVDISNVTGLEVQRLIVLDFTYVYEGQLITVEYPDIDLEVEYEIPEVAPIDTLIGWFGGIIDGTISTASALAGVALIVAVALLIASISSAINKKKRGTYAYSNRPVRRHPRA